MEFFQLCYLSCNKNDSLIAGLIREVLEVLIN